MPPCNIEDWPQAHSVAAAATKRRGWRAAREQMRQRCLQSRPWIRPTSVVSLSGRSPWLHHLVCAAVQWNNRQLKTGDIIRHNNAVPGGPYATPALGREWAAGCPAGSGEVPAPVRRLTRPRGASAAI